LSILLQQKLLRQIKCKDNKLDTETTQNV